MWPCPDAQQSRWPPCRQWQTTHLPAEIGAAPNLLVREPSVGGTDAACAWARGILAALTPRLYQRVTGLSGTALQGVLVKQFLPKLLFADQLKPAGEEMQ